MKFAIVLAFSAAALYSQEKKGPLVGSAQGMYAIAKGDVAKSMNKIPEEVWNFKPSPDVRTIGQLFAHIADGQYEFCGAANGETINKGIEKTAKNPAEIKAAMKEAFGYCDAVFAKMTEATAADVMPFFGMKVTRLGLMDFNFAHTMEHYGNLTTYMRMNHIVPPSSESQN